MKIKSIIIGLSIALMSTSCPRESVFVSFENKSNIDVIISYTKNRDSLIKIISRNYLYESKFKFLNRHVIKNDTLIDYDLDFYLSKDKTFYTFYFLKVVKFDTIRNDYIFEKRYDSINVDKDKILIGDEGKNIFTYGNKWLVFRANKNN